MANITYINGDATSPTGEGIKIITHCCNNYGIWGAGFVIAISKKWKQVKPLYQKWLLKRENMLGKVQFLRLEEEIVLANLIGQEGVGERDGIPPIRYDAIRAGLQKVNDFAKSNNASIHMPRIGCGLAGGSWKMIEEIIHEVVEVPVYVYDYGDIPWNP